MDKKITILCIDDEPLNLMLFEANFSRIFNVLTAGSAKEGLAILPANNDIKAIVCDMQMAEINGVEFTRMAKKDFPHIFYAILTGYNENEHIVNALETKLIAAVFKKPYKLNEIVDAIQKGLEDRD